MVMIGSASFGVVAAGLGATEEIVGAHASLSLTSTFYQKSIPAGATLGPYCGGLICYTWQDLKAAYNYPKSLDGSGQTIVLLDAFGDPTVQADLNVFDSTFGVPATTVQVVCQGGTCPTFNNGSSDELGWSQEITLDVQYSHAMAPGAHIVLFVAKNDQDLTLEKAALQAIKMFPHAVLSQSFGDPELDLLTSSPSYVSSVLTTGEKAYALAAREGTTVFASAGDWGADNSPFGFTSANPAYPSSSPLVTAVGGTMGNPYYLDSTPSCGVAATCSTGLVTFKNTAACQLNNPSADPFAVKCIPVGYGGEQVWNEPAFGAATGGAPSLIFPAPSYQAGLGLTGRATPDVSYDASIDGGVLGYWGTLGAGSPATGFYIFGGTSSGSPQWAAIAALADQLDMKLTGGTLGFINPALYEIGHNAQLYALTFHDITVGNNLIAGGYVGFNAGPGWDDASGWGTPNVANLVPWLVALT